MFKKIDQINKVKAFQVGKHLCYLHSERGVICSNGFEYETDPKGSIYLLRNRLFKQGYRGELEIFDIEQKQCVFANKKNDVKLFIVPYEISQKDLALYTTRIFNKKEDFGLYDFDSDIFYSKEVKIGVIITNLQMGLNWGGDLSSIDAVSLTSGELIWSFNDFKKYKDLMGGQIDVQVKNLLGSHNMNLWFGLSSGSVIALDSKTGDLVYELDDKNSNISETPLKVLSGEYLPFGELMQLDEGRDEIIGLRDNYFMRVDLNQPKLERVYINVTSTMEAHKIASSYRNTTFPSDEKYIFFCDDRQGKIGVFDREKLEVIWSYEVEIEKKGIAQILEMKYKDNRWYVLDRNDVLHIFERV